MAGNSGTAPAQTQAEIVAALRAQNAKTNSVVWNALQRVPGLLAGAGVDAANLLLGALAGRGFQGLSKKPVGGSESINEAFGLKKSDNTTQNAVEGVLGMMSPGGAAKAIIIPFTAAQATRAGVSKIADQARRTYARTGDNAKVLEESNKALKAANFPMAIEGLFFGPDMKLRASVSNEAFKPNFNKALFGVDPKTGAITLQGPLLGGQNTIRAQTVLPHETLYKLVPELQGTRIRHDPKLDAVSNIAGTFDVGANMIRLPRVAPLPLVPGVSPLQDLISTMIHEKSHGAAAYGGTRSGSAETPDALIKSLNEAKNMGSFSSTADLDEAMEIVEAIDWARAFPELASIKVPADPGAFINQTYRKIYGEREAVASESPGLPDLKLLMDSY
jgi:hypothetical protein